VKTADPIRRPHAYNPRAWNPLAQATACALLALLAVFLVAGV
jgi:hypothetical protein